MSNCDNWGDHDSSISHIMIVRTLNHNNIILTSYISWEINAISHALWSKLWPGQRKGPSGHKIATPYQKIIHIMSSV